MTVVIGTDEGLYTAELTEEDSQPTEVLAEVEVFQLESGCDADIVYAATDSGIYRITGDNSHVIGLSEEQVISVHQAQTGRMYAGTRPAHIYTSSDGGTTWTQIDSFEQIPGKEDWTQNYMGPAQVRDIRTHRNSPGKLFVAIETDGMYVSSDAGQTWEYRGRGLDNDPHGLQVINQDSLIATCGRGLYRTDNAGRLWYRLDTHQKYFWYQYFREGIIHNGVYHTSVMDRSTHRYQDVDKGLILISADGGETFTDQEFPGQDDDYVNAWATDGNRIYGGTVRGRLLRRPDEWMTADNLNATIRALSILE